MSHISQKFLRQFCCWVFLIFAGISHTALGQQSESIKVMHYNLLRFGNNCDPVSINQKASWLETILNFYQPDIFTVNELLPEAAFEALIEDACQSYNPAMQTAGFTNEAGSDIVNDLFFNSEIFGWVDVEVLPGAFRDISVYKLFVRDGIEARSDTIFLYCIVAHLKAGGSSEDASLRLEEVQKIRSWMENREGRGNILLLGDLNVDNAREEAWRLLVDPSETESPNFFGFYDPIDLVEDWNGPDFASFHTQSTRTSLPDCGVDGGLDDRFDFILTSLAIMEGSQKIMYEADSYRALGNGGGAFNQSLDCTGSEVPEILCNTLRQMSDHLPVVASFVIAPSLVSNKRAFSSLGYSIVSPFGEELQVHQTILSTNFPICIKLFSLQGKMVAYKDYKSHTSNYRLDTGSLSPGVYWVQLRLSNGYSAWEKLLK
ncbi:MAG: hypothetical protein AAGA10_27005 [Bacteroidota bacterium]